MFRLLYLLTYVSMPIKSGFTIKTTYPGSLGFSYNHTSLSIVVTEGDSVKFRRNKTAR